MQKLWILSTIKTHIILPKLIYHFSNITNKLYTKKKSQNQKREKPQNQKVVKLLLFFK